MNFRKASIFQRNTEKPEEQNDSGGMLAVWGSPGSGKTITAVKNALRQEEKCHPSAL